MVFESSGDTNGYRVVDVEISQTEEAQDLELTFTADATDYDGDTVTSEEFLVEFEGEELEGGYDIDGTPESDVIVGSSGDDIIHAGNGDDLVDGGEGTDEIYGEGGDDTLIAGNDDDVDTVVGGAGTDKAYVDPSEDVYDDTGTDLETIIEGDGEPPEV